MNAHDLVVDSLTEALLQLMEKKPLSEISISGLCQRAGVSRISFYRNYNSMQDILVDYLTRCTDKWWSEFSRQEEADIYRNFMPELIEQYRKNERLIKLLYKNNLSVIIKEHIFICCDVASEHEEKEAYARALLAGSIYGIVDEWIRRGMGEFPKDMSLRNILLSQSSS